LQQAGACALVRAKFLYRGINSGGNLESISHPAIIRPAGVTCGFHKSRRMGAAGAGAKKVSMEENNGNRL
jgi:hypothetical protein